MTDDFLKKLADELAADPDGRYAKKTPDEIAQMLNSPFRKQVPIPEPEPAEPEPAPDAGMMFLVVEAPALRVIAGVEGAPNSITSEDVIKAQEVNRGNNR